MKNCSSCLQTKSIDEFWKCRGQKNGYQSYCKSCTKYKKHDYIKSNPFFQIKHNKLNYERHKEKRCLSNIAWKLKNKELRKLQSKAYYLKNKNKIFDYQCHNKEKIRGKRREWAKKNPGLKCYYDALRRKKVLQAMPKWADKLKIKMIYIQCKNTTLRTGIVHHVDHIVPLTHDLVCGLHIAENLQVITASENSKKGNKFNIDQV